MVRIFLGAIMVFMLVVNVSGIAAAGNMDPRYYRVVNFSVTNGTQLAQRIDVSFCSVREGFDDESCGSAAENKCNDITIMPNQTVSCAGVYNPSGWRPTGVSMVNFSNGKKWKFNELNSNYILK